MGDAGISSDQTRIFHDVLDIHKKDTSDRNTTYTDIVSSSDSASLRLTAGVWTLPDFENESTPEAMVSEVDEFKYVVTGEAVLGNSTTAEETLVQAGDMIWIPKGSRGYIRRAKNFSTVYGEQSSRPIRPLSEPARSDPAIILQHLTERYVASNGKSKASFERACSVLPGGNTRSVLFYAPFPMTLASGRDCYVTSLDGQEYIDCVSEFTAGFLGHSNRDIQRAALDALLGGINLGGHVREEAELAECIVRRFRSIDMVRFCNSGTEANTFAIAVAKNLTRRPKVMVFANGYHGGTLTFTDNAHPMNLPHEYVWGTFNDIEKTRQVVQPDIAAVIVEPMQGAGGLIMATKEFLQFVREMATEIGAVLIFDEVITSRLRYGGLQEYFDVYPDMTTLGKYVGGGFSFGAFGGSKEIMARLDPRLPREDGGIPHSGTYNNNIFTMKAGIAAAKIVTPDAISRCNDLGDKLREGFRALLANRRVDYVGVSGFGSLIGIHFTGPHSSEWRDAFFFHMLERGVYTGRRGFMNLNLAHGHAHIDKILAAISAFVDLLPSS